MSVWVSVCALCIMCGFCETFSTLCLFGLLKVPWKCCKKKIEKSDVELNNVSVRLSWRWKQKERRKPASAAAAVGIEVAVVVAFVVTVLCGMFVMWQEDLCIDQRVVHFALIVPHKDLFGTLSRCAILDSCCNWRCHIWAKQTAKLFYTISIEFHW